MLKKKELRPTQPSTTCMIRCIDISDHYSKQLYQNFIEIYQEMVLIIIQHIIPLRKREKGKEKLSTMHFYYFTEVYMQFQF